MHTARFLIILLKFLFINPGWRCVHAVTDSGDERTVLASVSSLSTFMWAPGLNQVTRLLPQAPYLLSHFSDPIISFELWKGNGYKKEYTHMAFNTYLCVCLYWWSLFCMWEVDSCLSVYPKRLSLGFRLDGMLNHNFCNCCLKFDTFHFFPLL